MKFNKIFFGILAVSALTFTACSDYEDTDVLSPRANDDNVRILASNPASLELDPTDAQFELALARTSTNAAEYKINVIQNDENAFVFPETVAFADGETEATITVKMADNAPIGKAVSYEIALDDEVSAIYKADGVGSFAGAATIVKFNLLGVGQVADYFMYAGKSGLMITIAVNMYQRDDKPNVFRIENPYTLAINILTGWESWEFEYGNKTIDFVVDKDDLVTFDDIYLNLGYQGSQDNPIIAYIKDGTQADQTLVRDDEGNPLYFKLRPAYYVLPAVGGFGQSPL
ncbi:MAG: hypothetical protein ACI31D_03260, partial [Candidatus Limisoma sp.]